MCESDLQCLKEEGTGSVSFKVIYRDPFSVVAPQMVEVNLTSMYSDPDSLVPWIVMEHPRHLGPHPLVSRMS